MSDEISLTLGDLLPALQVLELLGLKQRRAALALLEAWVVRHEHLAIQKPRDPPVDPFGGGGGP